MLKILIVEDEPLLAETLKYLVELNPRYHVTAIADDLQSSLAAIEERRPDLALVDVRISGEADGTEVATVLRERDDVRSLFLTAYTDPETRDRAQASWPLGLIAKPVRPADLAAALRRAKDVVGEKLR